MTIDRSLEGKADAYALCFSAESISSFLSGHGWADDELKRLHIQTTIGYLESALRGSKFVNTGKYEGRGCYWGSDITNFRCLLEINPEFMKLKPEEFTAEVSNYIESLRALKDNRSVSEETKRKLASLCDAINDYTFSRLNPVPVT
jgi:hypothetical protein